MVFIVNRSSFCGSLVVVHFVFIVCGVVFVACCPFFVRIVCCMCVVCCYGMFVVCCLLCDVRCVPFVVFGLTLCRFVGVFVV